jgi:hypothetical protein
MALRTGKRDEKRQKGTIMKLIIATLILVGATAFGQTPNSTELIPLVPDHELTQEEAAAQAKQQLAARLKEATHHALDMGAAGYESAAIINKIESYDRFRDVDNVSTEYPIELKIDRGDLFTLTMRPAIYCHNTQKCATTDDSVVILLFTARSSGMGMWKFTNDDRELIFLTDNTRTLLGPADWNGYPSKDNLFEDMVVRMPLWKFRGIMAGEHVEGKLGHREFTVPPDLAHQLVTLFDRDTK